jgi:hypothetical protein
MEIMNAKDVRCKNHAAKITIHHQDSKIFFICLRKPFYFFFSKLTLAKI